MRFVRFSVLLFGVFVLGAGLIGCSSSRSASSGGDDETVVNTGYGKQSADRSTTATTTVTPSPSEAATANSLADLLEGQTAGVRVSSTAGGLRVSIRGPTTIMGDNTPLYVVDGTPVEPGLNGTISVNPQDVKSITILKDAGATSIYGSRGANGVVVIETRDQ